VSPGAKLVLAFDPTLQRLENAAVLKKLGPVEMQHSLLQHFHVCIPFVLVFFTSSEPLFHSRNDCVS
jgi:hypothetical protein